MPLQDWRKLARELAELSAPVAGADIVSLRGALGRVLAKPVIATLPLPAETHAVMDGYALGAVPPGQFRLLPAKPGHLGVPEAVVIKAGEAVPVGTATVVLADRVSIVGGHLTVREPQGKDNVRRAGEEAAVGAAILKPGVRIDARHVALAAAAAVRSVTVRARPRVALVALHEGAAPSAHLEVFSALLDSQSLAVSEGATVRSAMLAQHLGSLAARHDLIVVVSESLDDEQGPLAAALRAAGGSISVRRAALKPAKPIIVGEIGNARVIGLAGTAYATTVAAHLFLRPVLRRLAGLEADDPFLPATSGFTRGRDTGRAEALPARLRRVGHSLLLEPAGRFGQISALAGMDGFAMVEAEAPDLAAGDPLLCHPLLMPLF
jgi:molybdopterin molybdotransferase